MASYREKLIHRMTETESGKIAYALTEINRDYEKELEIHTNNKHATKLVDDIYVYGTGLFYVVYKYVETKANRTLEKVVWSFMDYDSMVRMLDAQDWQYI